ncbi:phage tail protein, partial [Salmonella enterica]|nr:phage tail protein [Salmonella enterica]EEG5665343.1 phage tail protein [Salmonella enterica]
KLANPEVWTADEVTVIPVNEGEG